MATPGRYFDAASGLPLHPTAIQARAAAETDGWADPNRLSSASRRSAVLLDAARSAVAEAFGVHSDEIIFTGSATTALHWAVLGAVAGRQRVGNRIVLSAVEHSAAFKAAQWHAERGGVVDEVGVDDRGAVDPDEFIVAAARPGVAVAVLQAANHEVGTRQPVETISAQLRALGVPLVCDATHALVWDRRPPAAPIFTADPRLWGGPAGVGLLVVRRGTRWLPPFPTDQSESGRGSGVPDVPSIVAAAAALRATQASAASLAVRLSRYVDRLRTEVPRLVQDTVVLGHPTDRLAHLVTFSCLYVDGEALLLELDKRGFTVSSGSSCTSDTLTPSHVLVAMGALTSGNVRVSLHADVSEADIDAFLQTLPEAVATVRAELPQPSVDNPGSGLANSVVTTTPDGLVIDSRGRRCPQPVLDLARAFGQLPVGAEVTVLADDPAAASDIAAWCRMQRQEFLGSIDHEDGATAYRVRRVG